MWFFSFVLVLCVFHAAAEQESGACDTSRMKRRRGTWAFDQALWDPAHASDGARATLLCDHGTTPASLKQRRTVGDTTIECINGQWIPELYFCFSDCPTSALRRIVGQWIFDPKYSGDRLPHGTKAKLICPDGYHLGTRGRIPIEDSQIMTCKNGMWRPNNWYCWPNDMDFNSMVLRGPPTHSKSSVPEEECVDREKSCEFWVSDCMSDSWVERNCCKTCRETAKTGCVDFHSRCWMWKHQCFDRFISKVCRKSCRSC